MTHVFVAPHPDDVALSCGGLIAGLRELGQSVTILTVFSGGPSASASPREYRRTAVGFGTKAHWPNMQAFNRTNIASDYPVPVSPEDDPPWLADPDRIEVTQERANTQARQFWQRAAWTRTANITNEASPERPLPDLVPAHGTLDGLDLASADTATLRKAEDERFAYFSEAALIDLDLPDAVHRGYVGDAELLGPPRPDDDPPVDALRVEILRLEPQQVYMPLGIGGHVDHRLCREAGLALLAEAPQWVMPAPDLVGRLSFYEDFPYAWWGEFPGLLDASDLELPAGVSLEARYADISDQLERKSAGLRLYATQIERLFENEQALLDDVAGYAARVAIAGGVGSGAAERYWAAIRA